MTDRALITYRVNKPAEIRVYAKYGEASEFVARHRHKNYSILPVERINARP
jgi:hypothetical protein